MGLREKRRKERRKKTDRRIIDYIMIIAGILLLIGCIAYLAHYYWMQYQNKKLYEEMQEAKAVAVVETEEVTEYSTEEETKSSLVYCDAVYDFEELQETNEEIYAWITVPGTQVDYPVLQTDTDNYYLDYNLDHTKGYPGCIYTNRCNTLDFSDQITVLYGHNMKNGSMFGSLHEFEDESFFEENQQIFVYTPDRRLTYEIYGAIKYSNVYIPAYYDVTTMEGKEQFLSDIDNYVGKDAVTHVREDMTMAEEDKLIVLSTCVNGDHDYRYVVVGRLAEEAYYKTETE